MEGQRRFEIPSAVELIVHRTGVRLGGRVVAVQPIADPSTERPFTDTPGSPRVLPRARASMPGPADGFRAHSLTNT